MTKDYTYFSAIAYTFACVTRCALGTSGSRSCCSASSSSIANWSAIGVSGSFVDASMVWNVGSSAGGVSGIETFAVDMRARSGSSTAARFNFFGGLRLAKRDDGGELARDDRCDVRRDSDFFK
jgi:hypothetical protein